MCVLSDVRTSRFRPCDLDFDLDPMILIYEFDVDILRMYSRTKK